MVTDTDLNTLSYGISQINANSYVLRSSTFPDGGILGLFTKGNYIYGYFHTDSYNADYTSTTEHAVLFRQTLSLEDSQPIMNVDFEADGYGLVVTSSMPFTECKHVFGPSALALEAKDPTWITLGGFGPFTFNVMGAMSIFNVISLNPIPSTPLRGYFLVYPDCTQVFTDFAMPTYDAPAKPMYLNDQTGSSLLSMEVLQNGTKRFYANCTNFAFTAGSCATHLKSKIIISNGMEDSVGASVDRIKLTYGMTFYRCPDNCWQCEPNYLGSVTDRCQAPCTVCNRGYVPTATGCVETPHGYMRALRYIIVFSVLLFAIFAYMFTPVSHFVFMILPNHF